jgi:hypothetical protein
VFNEGLDLPELLQASTRTASPARSRSTPSAKPSWPSPHAAASSATTSAPRPTRLKAPASTSRRTRSTPGPTVSARSAVPTLHTRTASSGLRSTSPRLIEPPTGTDPRNRRVAPRRLPWPALYAVSISAARLARMARNAATGSSCTWRTFQSPDSRMKRSRAQRPSQPGEGTSIGARSRLLSKAIVPASITPRSLSGPAGSSTSSQRNGIAPMWPVTVRSSAYSALRTSGLAELPSDQEL